MCHVNTIALQDIDPPNRTNDSLSQFQSNQSAFQNIAERLIRNGRIKCGELFITEADINA